MVRALWAICRLMAGAPSKYPEELRERAIWMGDLCGPQRGPAMRLGAVARPAGGEPPTGMDASARGSGSSSPRTSCSLTPARGLP